MIGRPIAISTQCGKAMMWRVDCGVNSSFKSPPFFGYGVWPSHAEDSVCVRGVHRIVGTYKWLKHVTSDNNAHGSFLHIISRGRRSPISNLHRPSHPFPMQWYTSSLLPTFVYVDCSLNRCLAMHDPLGAIKSQIRSQKSIFHFQQTKLQAGRACIMCTVSNNK